MRMILSPFFLSLSYKIKIDRTEHNTRRQIDAQNCENERKEKTFV